jgi:protein-S-isoprenylcysteine O-methyltransferase Ste14
MTFVFAGLTFMDLPFPARREEQALAAEFGEEWGACGRRVLGWIPRIRRR